MSALLNPADDRGPCQRCGKVRPLLGLKSCAPCRASKRAAANRRAALALAGGNGVQAGSSGKNRVEALQALGMANTAEPRPGVLALLALPPAARAAAMEAARGMGMGVSFEQRAELWASTLKAETKGD